MKLTLRKASVLQNQIQEVIKDIELKGSTSLNEFQDASDSLAEAKRVLFENLGRVTRLSQTLASIRAQIGIANVTSGVHAKLADLAVVEKLIVRYNELISSGNKAEDLAVVEGKLNKIRANDKASFYGSDSVETGLLDASDIETFSNNLRNLKKQKQKINDEILELNIRTEIELDRSIVELLETEKLI